MKTLVAIMSCHGRVYTPKVSAQLDTWVPAVSKHADVVIFTGAPQYKYYEPFAGEVCFRNITDTYNGIPQKVKAICQWAAARGYDRMAKVDDDVYIVPTRFPHLPFDGEYVGRVRAPYGRYPAPYASGFMYWLGKKAMQIVANTELNGDWMDERWIGNLLAYHKIFPYTDSRNYVVTGPHIQPSQLPNLATLRDATVFCQYGPVAMRAMHEAFANAPVIPSVKLERAIRVPVSLEQLYRTPDDRATPDKGIGY